MAAAKSPRKQKPRQVTVQPQEPEPPQGGPPARPQQKAQRPRHVAAGAQDRRTARDRDGNG